MSSTFERRAPLSVMDKRIRALAIVFALAFAGTLIFGAMLAYDYKRQNAAMTKCYAAATASHMEALAAQYQWEGNDQAHAVAIADAQSALRPIGSPDSNTAWHQCRLAFMRSL